MAKILMRKSIAARLEEMHQPPQETNKFDIHFVACIGLWRKANQTLEFGKCMVGSVKSFSLGEPRAHSLELR